jgi:hypothetical protein
VIEGKYITDSAAVPPVRNKQQPKRHKKHLGVVLMEEKSRFPFVWSKYPQTLQKPLFSACLETD